VIVEHDMHRACVTAHKNEERGMPSEIEVRLTEVMVNAGY
jgi:hypothetical protein